MWRQGKGNKTESNRRDEKRKALQVEEGRGEHLSDKLGRKEAEVVVWYTDFGNAICDDAVLICNFKNS